METKINISCLYKFPLFILKQRDLRDQSSADLPIVNLPEVNLPIEWSKLEKLCDLTNPGSKLPGPLYKKQYMV